jgi:hypothetical protein
MGWRWARVRAEAKVKAAVARKRGLSMLQEDTGEAEHPGSKNGETEKTKATEKTNVSSFFVSSVSPVLRF